MFDFHCSGAKVPGGISKKEKWIEIYQEIYDRSALIQNQY